MRKYSGHGWSVLCYQCIVDRSCCMWTGTLISYQTQSGVSDVLRLQTWCSFKTSPLGFSLPSGTDSWTYAVLFDFPEKYRLGCAAEAKSASWTTRYTSTKTTMSTENRKKTTYWTWRTPALGKTAAIQNFFSYMWTFCNLLLIHFCA